MLWPRKQEKRIYLDWASAAPVHEKAQQAFVRASAAFGNPSSPHEEGVKAKGLLEEARTKIARLAGVKARAVIFTSGATEANALAIQGRVKACQDAGTAYADMHVLYLPTMHSSVLKTIAMLADLGVQTEPLSISNNAIDLARLAQQLRPETVLIAADAVCGETGIRYDTLRIRRVIDHAKLAEAALLVDASQLPLVEPVERTRLGADFLVLDAQKVGGVRGVGALIVPDHSLIAPLMQGGGQEAGLRPGTEPVALIAAFAEALQERSGTHASFAGRAAKAREELKETILQELPEASVIEGKQQAPHILNISLPGIDTDYLVMLLDADGFAVSTKSACETDSEEGSKVILALTGDQARAASTLRISWGPETDERDLKAFSKALLSSVRFLKESAI